MRKLEYVDFFVTLHTMANFTVHYLGCGSASPSERHLPSCQVVDFRDKLLMIDCGEGAQLQFRRAHLKFARLSHIFVSHLHGDHFLGLPGLLSTLSMLEVEGTVTVHIFREGLDILRRILNVFCPDRSYNLVYAPIEHGGGLVLDDKSLTVEAFPLYHRVPAVGFIFREKPKPRRIIGDMVEYHKVPVYQRAALKEGADFITPEGQIIENSRLTLDPLPSGSYAYCSDTRFDPRVAEAVSGVDTLYHESTYLKDNEQKAAPRGHSTAAEAGTIATMAGAKRLVLGHYSKSYNDDSLFEAEAATTFKGDIIAAREGLKIDIPYRSE